MSDREADLLEISQGLSSISSRWPLRRRAARTLARCCSAAGRATVAVALGFAGATLALYPGILPMPTPSSASPCSVPIAKPGPDNRGLEVKP